MAMPLDELEPGDGTPVRDAEVEGIKEAVGVDVIEERLSVGDAVGSAELVSIVMLKYAEVCWALDLLSCSQKKKMGESES